MSDLTRRTLRTWAVAAAAYGVLLAIAVAVFLPWKTPAANLGLIAYGALHLASAPGLWRCARWGWRLGVATSLLGFVGAVVLVTGLLGSWAYLRGVFGEFGLGASIGALLFASVAVQVLGLYPALEIRALLRREVRADFGAGKGLARAVLGLLAVPFVVALVVQVRYGLDPLPPLTAEARTEAIAHLRAAVDGKARPPTPALVGVPVGEAPLYVTLWREGKVHARVTGEGADLAEAVARAADALAGHERVRGRRDVGGRLKVDRVVATAPVLADAAPVVALSVNPGLDGLRRVAGDAERTLLPEDLVKMQLFGAAPLVPGIRELRLGLDAATALARLGLPEGRLERVRTEGFVEHEGAALPELRGNTPAPDGPAAWRQAAIEGGDFILRQIREDGRFHYQYYPLENRHSRTDDNAYSLPRHSGTVYALALLYGLTGEARFKAGAERAIAWLGKQIPPACGAPDRACVAKGRSADLGSTALTLVGMLEYQRRTGDARYADQSRRLLEFVLWLQRADGDFHHVYDLQTNALVPQDRRLFFSEEAALALVMAHEVLGDQRYLDAAERALDYLTGPKYHYFLGRFIYGADHWTCIAAEEAHPRLKSPKYLDFCLEYAAFIRRLQFAPGEWRNTDFTGHYGFTALMVPQAAAAGFTEAVISAWELSKKHGRPDEAVRVQAAIALDALARESLRPDNAWMMPDPAAARGGIRRSLVEQEVRIDFTQHAASALIRGAVM